MAETKKNAAAIQDARLDRLERVLDALISWAIAEPSGRLERYELEILLKELRKGVERNNG